MRIAYLCADFGIPIQGYKGASVHVRELVAALSSQGHEVQVFSPSQGAGNRLAVPLRVVTSEGLPDAAARLVHATVGRHHPRLDKETRELLYNLTLYRRLGAQLRQWQPDVIYERYSLFNLAGLNLARRLGVPHLLEVNAPLRLERARTKGIVLAGVAGRIERVLFGGSDTALVVSEALRRYVLEHSGGNARVVVQPNAVDTGRFLATGPDLEVRARLELSPEAFVVGFAGSLKPWHGVDALLDAFAAVRSQEPLARLLVVGEGPEEQALRARAAALGLGPDVVFAGRVEHAVMPRALAAMDVGVAPYLPAPDFYFSPLKLYEYMAVGLAVVASDAGEIAGLLRHGHTGLLCPPGNTEALAGALLRMAQDPSTRLRLGAAARAEAERHTWAENARLVTELAQRLTATRIARHPGRRTSAREAA
jgi:glycosyltransferase involved in cell wall biosynthesis